MVLFKVEQEKNKGKLEQKKIPKYGYCKMISFFPFL